MPIPADCRDLSCERQYPQDGNMLRHSTAAKGDQAFVDKAA